MNKVISKKLYSDDITVISFYYHGEGDPVLEINNAVINTLQSMGEEDYTEYIDSQCDNPWTRILVIGKNARTIVNLDEL